MSSDTEVTKEMVDESIACFRNIARLARKASEFARSVSTKIEIEHDDSSHGISFLEFKNRILLAYLQNEVQVMRRKVCGSQLEGSDSIDRLVEYRTVLEKMRPVQHKLKYQIEKAIAQAKRDRPLDEALLLKPNVNNLLDSDDEDNQIESTTTTQVGATDDNSKTQVNHDVNKDSTKLYLVPKINPVEYEYEQSEKRAKQQERLEKAKKRAAATAMVREFTAQFDEEGAPEEVNELSVGQRKAQRDRVEKRQYEEEYLVRLNEKKKKPGDQQQQLLTINTLGDSLTHFQDVSALDAQDAEEYDDQRKANRSSRSSNHPKLPKKVVKKIKKRADRRAMRKRMRL